MKPLKSTEIIGNWATIFLPIEEDESINYTKLSDQIDRLISMRPNGIYSNGTAAEFYNQTEDEFDAVNGLLAEKCNAAGQPFQIGCNHMSPKISLERLRRAVQLKPGAIQVILPDWFPPSFTEMLRFLERMAREAGDVGLVIYNPPHAKRKLLPEEYRKIKTEGIPVVGCKTAGGDEQWYAEMNGISDFSVFIPGSRMATGISRGAHGAYSNVACIHPLIAQQWYESMADDMPKALELEGRIQQFIQQVIVPLMTENAYADPAIDKLLSCLAGWADSGPRLRWPYQAVSRKEIILVRDACKKLLPEFFENV
ncbi:dihydrodipicolinate synthase family protein [Flavisolibacter ginsenosidimutans]|uniref:Dihydrodipicolinate synthase family protein n=1 Tax=Flavisolibacter ginsenosidimutans TaxID=661481 RepID=A0A5B8UCM6_9BACT|nr:dihydrodipicolinate synthase family protein [Flavisolibacter ginsenosidimutans]QEC54401.1 dihydrodipicolinate synthase family protein [Flavisolibacter ginsenosidimutans]